jgi:hypothetical protein
MSDETKKIHDMPPPEEELSPEEAEAAQGGAVEYLRGSPSTEVMTEVVAVQRGSFIHYK